MRARRGVQRLDHPHPDSTSTFPPFIHLFIQSHLASRTGAQADHINTSRKTVSQILGLIPHLESCSSTRQAGKPTRQAAPRSYLPSNRLDKLDDHLSPHLLPTGLRTMSTRASRGRKQAKKGVQLTLMVVGESHAAFGLHWGAGSQCTGRLWSSGTDERSGWPRYR